MEAVLIEGFSIVMRESPYLALAVCFVIIAGGVVKKLIPHVAAWFDARAEAMRAREKRKRDESEERSRLEGQWLATMQQSNRLHEKSNDLSVKLSDKLDKDAEDRKRLEAAVGIVDTKLDALCGDMKVIKDRSK